MANPAYDRNFIQFAPFLEMGKTTYDSTADPIDPKYHLSTRLTAYHP